MFSQPPMIREMLDEACEEVRRETYRQNALEILKERFGKVSKPLESKVLSVEDEAEVTALFRRAISCANLKEFSELLKAKE